MGKRWFFIRSIQCSGKSHAIFKRLHEFQIYFSSFQLNSGVHRFYTGSIPVHFSQYTFPFLLLRCHFPSLTSFIQGVFYKRNGSIYFSSIDESHAGRYSCTPYNDLGTEGPSPLIHVFVQHPPVFTLKPKPIYVHKLGDTVTMQCDASENDGRRPEIQWRRKDGTPLPFGRVQIDNINFAIENINETDRGIYECVASNSASTLTVDAELLIENVAPRPPYNLTANSSDTAITLRWEPGKLIATICLINRFICWILAFWHGANHNLLIDFCLFSFPLCVCVCVFRLYSTILGICRLVSLS